MFPDWLVGGHGRDSAASVASLDRGSDRGVDGDAPGRRIDRFNGPVPYQIAGVRQPVEPLIRIRTGESAHVERGNPRGGAGATDDNVLARFEAGCAVDREGAGSCGRHLVDDMGGGFGMRRRGGANLQQRAA